MVDEILNKIRRKLILVDDSKFSLMMGEQRLQDVYDVYTAISAEEMFDTLDVILPDVILLDVNMPHLDGYETIVKLKADVRYEDIPVIFVTGKSDENSMIRGLSLGAADYITKPFSASYLHERIETLLNPDYQEKLQNEAATLNKKNVDKPCVLAIDDVPYMLRSIQHALRDKFNVYTLSKPEMLEKCLERMTVLPKLFLLDYNMPLINGFDLFLQIRSLPAHKQTPIVFLTSEATMDKVQEAINLGASDFMVKPFDANVLRTKITKHIRAVM
ncbi:MAG: response regulator [Planctomycetaceae bacterium]|nr:response regulator [Planctomycetaceae bacterium]